jgi:hypothetical protein
MRSIQSNPAKSKIQLSLNDRSSCDHLLQVYQNDQELLNALASFVGDGLLNGDGCIVIAFEPHRKGLEQILTEQGVDLDAARKDDLYIAVDAVETLSAFMVDGWPDETLFASHIGGILARARKDGRHVRAFGEMVANLWADNNYDATVRLEYLWQELCAAEGFSLLCAYPHDLVSGSPNSEFDQVRANHTGHLQAAGLDGMYN